MDIQVECCLGPDPGREGLQNLVTVPDTLGKLWSAGQGGSCCLLQDGSFSLPHTSWAQLTLQHSCSQHSLAGKEPTEVNSLSLEQRGESEAQGFFMVETLEQRGSQGGSEVVC